MNSVAVCHRITDRFAGGYLKIRACLRIDCAQLQKCGDRTPGTPQLLGPGSITQGKLLHQGGDSTPAARTLSGGNLERGMARAAWREGAMMPEKLTYGSYLRVSDLLDLQTPLSEPEHHDELLFIVIHQVYELWFKQVIHELDGALAHLRADDLLKVGKNFRRIHAIQRLLEQQVDILETMTPQEFNAFRDNLNPASGFQSIQFREIEFLAGAKNPQIMINLQLTDAERGRLARRLAEPSMYDVLKAMLARRGFASANSETLLESFRRIYTDAEHHYDLYLLLEDFIEFDERFLLWRGRHVRMVERMIGLKMGTGGSPGVAYLQATLDKKFFPELWSVRTLLGSGNYGS